jgi:hypothetical protein
MWVDCIPFAGTTLPKMSAYVCSLFEGTYHLGLGALVNSLYRNGFRSTVFAGPGGIVVVGEPDFNRVRKY